MEVNVLAHDLSLYLRFLVCFFIPDAEGAEVAQKTQKRKCKFEKVDWPICSNRLFFVFPVFTFGLLLFSAPSAQLLRPLRPVLKSVTPTEPTAYQNSAP
jgi:hypothetical protein